MTRLEQARAITSGAAPGLKSDDPCQRPTFFDPGLSTQARYDSTRLTWIVRPRAGFGDLAKELGQLLIAKKGFEPVFPTYSSGGRWATFWLLLYEIGRASCRE